MSAAPFFNLERAPQRSCFWTPDWSGVSFLKPRQGSVLLISGPQQYVVQDSANQTLAANATIQLNYNANTLKAGTVAPLAADQAVIYENIFAGIQPEDTSAKIQILNIYFGLGDNYSFFAAESTNAWPFLLPALSNVGPTFSVYPPIPLLVPRPSANPCVPAPQVAGVLVNTDASAHTYRRSVGATYRIVSGCDFTSGPSLPGAGIGR